MARAALASKKRAIVAGPGNPPVVVDATACLENAARSIVTGGAFDNNLLCIGEKQVFAVAQIFDSLMDVMTRHGAFGSRPRKSTHSRRSPSRKAATGRCTSTKT